MSYIKIVDVVSLYVFAKHTFNNLMNLYSRKKLLSKSI